MREWLKRGWKKLMKTVNEPEPAADVVEKTVEEPEETDEETEDDVQVYSINEYAEMLGMFPSDVEEECKKLQEQGLVKCTIADGKVYVVLTEEGASFDELLLNGTKVKKDNPMYG